MMTNDDIITPRIQRNYKNIINKNPRKTFGIAQKKRTKIKCPKKNYEKSFLQKITENM